MRAVATKDTNVKLTAPGAGPLPAERCEFENPRPPFERSPGFETTWLPDEGEQRALANGAPVVLRLWGRLHPPVSVGVGEPGKLAPGSEPQRLLNMEHVYRAVGRLYTQLAQEAEDATPPAHRDGRDTIDLFTYVDVDEAQSVNVPASWFLELFEQALIDTKTT